MKKLLALLLIAIVLQGISIAAKAPAQPTTKAPAKVPVNIGFRGGLGMDISGGLAYGLSGNYQLELSGMVTELGVHFYGSSSKTDSTNGVNRYTETTNLLVFGCMANYLLNYSASQPGLFFVGGVGLAAVNVDWTESSPTDTSLGTLLPGGGSKQSINALAGGSVVNLGIGYLFDGGLDLRFEVPTIFVFGTYGKASSVIPTFTLTGGYRF